MRLHMVTPIVVIAIFFASISFSEAKTVRVKGKMRKNGTYVQPHSKSSPDKSRYNNYDSKGNVNPYTGKKGTKDPTKSRKIK